LKRIGQVQTFIIGGSETFERLAAAYLGRSETWSLTIQKTVRDYSGRMVSERLPKESDNQRIEHPEPRLLRS